MKEIIYKECWEYSTSSYIIDWTFAILMMLLFIYVGYLIGKRKIKWN